LGGSGRRFLNSRSAWEAQGEPVSKERSLTLVGSRLEPRMIDEKKKDPDHWAINKVKK
jgi:hypothetical protein